MEFNFSHKVNPETGDFKMVIDGDKGFIEYLNKTGMLFQFIVTNLIEEFSKILATKKQKPLTPTELTLVDGLPVEKPHTIAVNDYMANLIIYANPEIIDKIVLIKDPDGKTLGLEIK